MNNMISYLKIPNSDKVGFNIISVPSPESQCTNSIRLLNQQDKHYINILIEKDLVLRINHYTLPVPYNNELDINCFIKHSLRYKEGTTSYKLNNTEWKIIQVGEYSIRIIHKIGIAVSILSSPNNEIKKEIRVMLLFNNGYNEIGFKELNYFELF